MQKSKENAKKMQNVLTIKVSMAVVSPFVLSICTYHVTNSHHFE